MSEEEYKETLEDKILAIADKLKGHDYMPILKKELKDIEEPEEKDIERAFKAVLEFIEVKRSNNNHKAQPIESTQSSDNPDKMLSRKAAAKRINVSLSTFKRSIQNGDIKEYSYGRIKRYKASDVDGLLKIMLGTSVPALCKERLGYFGRKNYKILVFEKGKIYDIINENSNWIWIYNREWMESLRLSKTQFRKYFSIKGELEYDANRYGGGLL